MSEQDPWATRDENGVITTFWGYPVEEAIAIIKRAEEAGLADPRKRLWGGDRLER